MSANAMEGIEDDFFYKSVRKSSRRVPHAYFYGNKGKQGKKKKMRRYCLLRLK